MTNGSTRKPKVVSPALRLLWPLVRRKLKRSTSGPASDAARSSIAADTLTGQTGLLIGTRATPVTPIKAAQDPRAVQAVRKLTERHTPLPDEISN